MLIALPVMLRRRGLFKDAPAKVEALCQLHRDEQFDLVICTGDFVGLGTNPELAAAREALAPLLDAPLGFIGVPGNHDAYLAGRGHRVEDYFADVLHSDVSHRPVDGPWPLVRVLTPSLAVIALNSARVRPSIWDATGRMPDEQVHAMRNLAHDRELARRFVFVVTHYAPRLSDGEPDRPSHRMVNAEQFLDACSGLHHGAILSGHVHERYAVKPSGLHLPIFCAGSATHEGREGFWVYEMGDQQAMAIPGFWDGERYRLDRVEEVRL